MSIMSSIASGVGVGPSIAPSGIGVVCSMTLRVSAGVGMVAIRSSSWISWSPSWSNRSRIWPMRGSGVPVGAGVAVARGVA